MAVRYVTTDDFDAICSAPVRRALFDDSTAGDGTGYVDSLFIRAAELASSLAKAAAQNAGYDTGDEEDGSDSVDAVRALALSALVRIAYGRRQKTVPEAIQETLGGLMEGVRVGDVPIPDLTPSAALGVGGVTSTDASSSTSGGRPPVMRDIKDYY